MVGRHGGTQESRAGEPRCWCGEHPTKLFSEDYLYCGACGTLVLSHPPDTEALLVKDDDQDFYGRSYYETYLTDRYKYPPVSERARRDLGERCLHWLRALLKYRLPPAAVLELGSAHGGFVAMLRQAGYEATGLEVSPSVVEMARRTFGVPMLLGPLEQQHVPVRSLDVVVMMDVIEHLPDPLGTLKRCQRLLRPGGLILVQTPGYPDGKSLRELGEAGDRFVEQLKPAEHLFLYSERAIRTLLERSEIPHVSFEPAIFAHYDTFFVASRAPLSAASPETIANALAERPASRFVLALLDLDDGRRQAAENHGRRVGELEAERNIAAAERDNLRRQFEFVEADRAARLQVIEEHARRLGELEGDRNFATMERDNLRRQFEFVEADRAARLQVIEEQSLRLGNLEAARTTLLAEVGDLRKRAELAEADGVARSAVIERQIETIRQLEIDLASVKLDRSGCLETLARQARQLADGAAELGDLARRNDHLRDRLERTEQAVAEARQAVALLEQTVEGLDRTVFDLARAAGAQRNRIEKLSRWRDDVQAVLAAIRRSRLLKAYRLFGGWKPMDAATRELLESAPSEPAAGAPPSSDEVVTLVERRRMTWPELPALPEISPGPSYAEAERLAERLAVFIGRPEFFHIWERHGVHVTPAHFYSPIPILSALEAAPWRGPLPLTGIDMREAHQLALLETCREFRAEYQTFADQATRSPHEYFRDQPMLRVVDAELLHCLIRRAKPKRIIEVGSGFSTRVTAAALLKNAAEGHPGRFVAIEPYPDEVLRKGIPGLSELRIEPAQSLPASFADGLDENDMLFIDSSHVVRIDSDVRFLFLEVLPRLKPGVLVHVHDVFLPAEYPRSWVVGEHRFWNEQYLLHALLLFSRAFEIVWAGSFMHMRHPDALERVFPAYGRQAAWPGSFWFRRVAENEDSRP